MAPGFSFLFLVWAWWLPLILATAARVAHERGEGCSAKTCGNLIISYPFWITQKDTERPCGSLDYQVDCNNSTPILRSSSGSGYGFAIVNISYQESSLRVVDSIKVADLKNSSDCHIPTWNTSAKLGLPFRINPDSLNLIFYNCTKAPAAALWVRGLVETKCRHSTFVRLGGRYDGSRSYDGYSLQGCSTTILPVLGTPGKANASSYEELMSNGFLLTWERPRPAGGSVKSVGSDTGDRGGDKMTTSYMAAA